MVFFDVIKWIIFVEKVYFFLRIKSINNNNNNDDDDDNNNNNNNNNNNFNTKFSSMMNNQMSNLYNKKIVYLWILSNPFR